MQTSFAPSCDPKPHTRGNDHAFTISSTVCHDGHPNIHLPQPLAWQRARRWPVGGPLWEPAWRSAGPCPDEAALPWVTCCPLFPRYLSHADSSFLFLSKPSSSISPLSPLLCWVWHGAFHAFANTGYQGQGMLSRPRCITLILGHMTSRFRRLPNDGGQATGPRVWVQSMWVALTSWRGVSQRSSGGVITSPSCFCNWTSWPLKSPWTGWDAVPAFIRRAAYGGWGSKTDKVKALLWPVINWSTSQAGRGGGEWHSEDTKGMRKSQIQRKRGALLQDKNISSCEGWKDVP